MSAATAVWLKVGLVSGTALALLILASPPTPTGAGWALAAPLAGLSYLAAAALGVGSVVKASSSSARACHHARPDPHALLRIGLVCFLAAGEEIIWRRVALGELLRRGQFTALAATAVVFALGHRERQALHLATGSVLGGLYLATGALTACICAHWSYNLFVARRVSAARGADRAG